MASFANRSRYRVSVPRRPDLQREFPFDAEHAARAYLVELRGRGLKPRLAQYEDHIEVRIRTRGYRELHFTASSYAEAERSAARIEEERSRGLFQDYTKSMGVTLAQLIRRYLLEECLKHKSCEVETYKLNALLIDSGDDPVTYAEQHRDVNPRVAPRNATGRQMRHTITTVEWLHRPFAMIEPTDIEDYIRDRLQSVAPATVDRELDHLSSVINVAIKTWRYHVAISPMAGVRRPRYFNERDRRLVGDEQERLLAAARQEDRLRSVGLRLEELLADARAVAATQGSASSRKRAIARAREALLPQAEATAEHIPLFETLIQFLLMTGVRRGEALSATWDQVLVAERYVFLPETKNGRPRKVPLMQELIGALAELPRDDDRVFPITTEQLRDAWSRICERAGIQDFHVHDCRHEAVSRIAETGKFSLLDLQAISGHRDARMLQRYAHLCVRKLAERLDEAFPKASGALHKGRLRGGKGFSELISAEPPAAGVAPSQGDAGAASGDKWPGNVVPLFGKARSR